MSKEPISVADARRLFTYDPDTGALYRINDDGTTRELAAGQRRDTYLKTSYKRTFIWLHRLAWALHFGEWPRRLVDHVNGVKSDNRICNLRAADHTQNLCNAAPQVRNTSGYKGVSWHATGRKWRAEVTVNGKHHYLGLFASVDKAAAAAREARARLHGAFARDE